MSNHPTKSFHLAANDRRVRSDKINIAKTVGDYTNPRSLGSRFRRARVKPLLDMIDAVHQAKGSVAILDVGGLESYWNIIDKDYLKARNVTILLLNLANDVKLVTQPEIFTAHAGDGCALPFPDRHFDICHSNSVVEHVGVWRYKEAFAREVTRVADRYFHQTPNYWFPWEPHFGAPIFHWLPEPVRVWIAMRADLGWHKRATTVTEAMQVVEYASLLNHSMVKFLFPEAKITRERFLGMTKSFIVTKS